MRYPTPAFQCWLHINCPNSWSSLLRARVSVSQRWPPFNYRNPRQHVTLIRGICGWICCGANLFWGSSFLIFPFFLFLILCLFEDLLIDFVCVLGFLHVHMCTMCVQVPMDTWRGYWMPYNKLWAIRYGSWKTELGSLARASTSSLLVHLPLYRYLLSCSPKSPVFKCTIHHTLLACPLSFLLHISSYALGTFLNSPIN